MRFVVFYRNRPDLRRAMEHFVLKAFSQGHDFLSQPIRTEFFQTFVNWPNTDQINKLPFWIQVQEVEILNNQLRCLKQLILEAEIISIDNDSQLVFNFN